jgi:hypothetical protein
MVVTKDVISTCARRAASGARPVLGPPAPGGEPPASAAAWA